MNESLQAADMAVAREIHHAMEAADHQDHDLLLTLRMRWDQEIVAPISERLGEQDPEQNPISAFIIARDHAEGIRADVMLEDGKPWQDCLYHVGSYGRCEWIKRHVQSGAIPKADVLPMLPDLWRGSDPDDTDIWWLLMWEEAWAANGRTYVRDGDPLPQSHLVVYRGQIGEDSLGISWSLSQDVAVKFARTGGGRMNRLGGVILQGKVHADNVMAYLTQRHEQEVIVFPPAVKGIATIGKMVPRES